MATTYQHQCDVNPGVSTEYFKTFTLTADGDIIEFYFDKEFTINDLVISLTTGTIVSSEVALIYPVSNATLKVKTSLSSFPFNLNNTSSPANMWYRVPGGTKLRFTATDLTGTTVVNIFVIGA